jgi:transcriptional regulator with XRE-family HTH domain
VVFTIKVGRCRIQELLDARGWTQQELANKTGMTKQYINDKIKGRGKHGMWIDSAKIIATALGCSIDDLYEWLPEYNNAQEDAGKGGKGNG